LLDKQNVTPYNNHKKRAQNRRFHTVLRKKESIILLSSIYQTFVESREWNCRFDYYLLQTEETFCPQVRRVFSLLVTEMRAGTVVDHLLFYDIGTECEPLIAFLDTLASEGADLDTCAQVVDNYLCEMTI
jgi:hypothetical protein